MINRVSSRLLLFGSCLGLVAAVVAGGALISVFEDLSYRGGVWIAFSVVSTTGFGEGPQTLAGVLSSMAVFAFTALCWFAFLVTGVELGLPATSTALSYRKHSVHWPTAAGRTSSWTTDD